MSRKPLLSPTKRTIIAAILIALLAGVVIWMIHNQGESEQAAPRPPIATAQDVKAPVSPPPRPSSSVPTPPNPPSKSDDSESSAPKPDQTPPEPMAADMRQVRWSIDGEMIPLEHMRPRGEFDPNKPSTEFAIEVSGRVVAVDGTPIAGATVVANEFALYEGARPIRTSDAIFYHRGRSANCVLVEHFPGVSDENGAYTMTVKGWFETPPENAMQWTSFEIVATHGALTTVESRIVSNRTSTPMPATATLADLILAAPTTVEGVVVWGDTQTPVESASVALTRPATDSYHTGALGFMVTSAPPEPLERRITAAGGAFRFEGVTDGEYRCWAVVPGTTHAQWRFKRGSLPMPPFQAAKVTIKNGVAVSGLKLELYREMRILFRTNPELEHAPEIGMYDQQQVKDGKGTVAEESQELRIWRSSSLIAKPMPQWSATKQPDGSFAVAGLAPDHSRLWVFAKGYRPAMARLTPVPGKDFDAGVIELDLGAMIEGVVTDEEGRPVEGATVGVAPDSMSGRIHQPRSPPILEAITDRDGRYKLTGLVAGRFQVLCRAEGFQERDAFTTATSGDAATLNMTLIRPDAVVFGRIEWGAIGPPRVGASTLRFVVVAIDADSDVGRRTTPGKPIPSMLGNPGRIEIPVVTSDWTFRSSMKAGNYKFVFANHLEESVIEQTLTTGTETEIVFKMGQLSTLRGTVYNHDRIPIPYVKVLVVGPVSGNSRVDLKTPYLHAATVEANASGEYEATGLKGGMYVVWLPDFPELQQHPAEHVRSKRSVTLALGAESVLDIYLDQRPDGATVWLDLTLNGEPSGLRSGFSTGMILGVPNPDPSKSANHPGFFALPDGRIVATGVPVGTHQAFLDVSVPSATGPGGSAIDSISVTVRPGETVVRITHDVKTAKLSGKVKIPDGVTFARGTFQVSAMRVNDPTTDTKGSYGAIMYPTADGAFSREPLAHGWYRVEVRAKGFVNVAKVIELTSDTYIELELSGKSGTVVLEFDGLEGDQPADVLAMFKQGNRHTSIAITDASGEIALQDPRARLRLDALFATGQLKIPDLTPGPITISMVHDMAEQLTLNVEVPSDGEVIVKVKFRLGPKLTITLPASDVPANTTSEGILILVRMVDKGPSAGSIHLTAQPDGSYAGTAYLRAHGSMTLRATRSTITEETKSIHLAPGAEATHVIRFAKE